MGATLVEHGHPPGGQHFGQLTPCLPHYLITLSGMERLFFRGRSKRGKARHIVEALTRCPVLFSQASQYPSNVASGCSSAMA
jgi:hypothetical protein